MRRAQTDIIRRRSSFRRRFSSIAAALGLVVASMVALPTAAHAAPNPDIVVGSVSVSSPGDEQATVGDTLTISGSWDASEANPQTGDTFTIGLPPELGFPQAVPFALEGPNGDGVVVTWATCLTDPATSLATCTLTDEVTANPELVQGTFEVDVEALLATNESEVIFDLNGTATPVELPGGGGIDDGVELPDDWDKSGEMNSDKWSMSWTINLPGARLAGEDTINIFEQLSDNHQLCEPANLKVETVRGSTVVDVTSIAVTSTEVAEPYDFSIVLTAPEGGFDPGVTYRITYDTCTPDGQIDPEGTVYENEATVDVWGESSGVIGVNQDWSISDMLSKQGNVLGGADRNGKIAWTVTVAGDHLVGKDSFTLSEQLTGEHEVCSDTISGVRVFEQYGPSATQRRDITAELTPSTISSSTDAFEVSYSVAEGSEFEFRASDYLYLIEYETCASTDGLPEGETVFGNTAGVDGAVDGSEATVPGRTDQKRGSINAASVTIDGVTYLPQTTLNWAITVPGEKLVGVESDLVVTDVISGAHEVCLASGGDVADRLGLRVEARDQVSNGGLSTVDLTSTVDAVLDDDTLQFTIPQPTLAQPDGTSASGFSREYQFVISYTTCTISGGMDAPGTVYGNTATVEGSTYTQSVTQNNRGSGTGTGVPRGSVDVVKNLAETAGAAFVPDDAVFTVHVREIDPTGVVQIEYDLEIPVAGDPVSGPNSRGTGWTIELSEPTFPEIPGVAFGDPVFTEAEGVEVSEDGATAVAALVPGSNIAVELTNTAQMGSIDVEKLVEGEAADLVDADREYAMTAEVDVSGVGDGFPSQPDREFTLAVGDTHVLDDLPIGAVVTLTETLPADDDVLTWLPVEITPGSLEVDASHVTSPGQFTVTNTVERTRGTFSLVKDVTGDQSDNPAVPDEVTVTATWQEDGGEPDEKTLTLPTDGTPVPLDESLLIGTDVTLTETPLADGSSIAWGAPTWSGTGVTLDGDSAVVNITRDADATVSVENHAATSVAGISILKGIGGEAATEVSADTEFPVTATWDDADGVEQSKELSINAVTPTPLGEELLAGTVVTITEEQRPDIDTVIWDSITISGNDVTDNGDGSATVIASTQQDEVTLITVVNEATWAPGTFEISKSITGVLTDHPDVPTDVVVTASWLDLNGEAQAREMAVPVTGERIPFGADLPHGTVVTLTELTPADAASFTWDTPSWSADAVANDDGTATVVIGAATTAEVSLTNNAIAALSSIELLKSFTGGGASDVPSSTQFPVTIEWTDLLGEPQQQTVSVRAGSPTLVEGIPVGVEVTVSEQETDLPDAVHWEGVTWLADEPNATVANGDSHDAVLEISDGSEGVTVTLENEFADAAGLAVTGAEAARWAVAGALAAMLIAAGAVLILRKRRSV